MFDPTLQGNKHRVAMSLVMDAIYTILTKKVPEQVIEKMEKEQKGFKIDNIYDKI